MTVPPPDFQGNWQRYKKLRNLSWITWLGYIPAVGVFTVFVSRVFKTYVPGFVFAGMWMLMFPVVGNPPLSMALPRCGKPFSKKWWYDKGFFARKCVHCGPPKYASGWQQSTASGIRF